MKASGANFQAGHNEIKIRFLIISIDYADMRQTRWRSVFRRRGLSAWFRP
jgi:hypothetical protein